MTDSTLNRARRGALRRSGSRLLARGLCCGLLASCAAPTPTVPRPVVIAQSTCPRPVYPAEARQHEAAGATELDYDVSPEGKVTRVALAKPSGTGPGHRILDALAMETLAKCSFPPAPGFLSASSRIVYQWRLED